MKKKLLVIICILATVIAIFGYFNKKEEVPKEAVKKPVIKQEENEEIKEVEKEVVVKKEDDKKEIIDSKEIKKPDNESIKKAAKPVEEEAEEIEVTEGTIVQKYTKQFANLKSEFNGKLATLLGEAKGEYNALSDEDKMSEKFSLGLKYLKKGKALEKECDGRFYGVLDEMKKELEENEYSLDSAGTAKAEYKKQKSERRKALMKKALGK
ncbi:hypothetical protein IZY60_05585 [Lutibacter sp. B2]|nr:hypothetical protein [Lutibacter sp. B2]